MAFTKEATRTAVAIGSITIELRRGDLVPHLTQAQVNSLQSFMNSMRQKAIAEILP